MSISVSSCMGTVTAMSVVRTLNSPTLWRKYFSRAKRVLRVKAMRFCRSALMGFELTNSWRTKRLAPCTREPSSRSSGTVWMPGITVVLNS